MYQRVNTMANVRTDNLVCRCHAIDLLDIHYDIHVAHSIFRDKSIYHIRKHPRKIPSEKGNKYDVPI